MFFVVVLRVFDWRCVSRCERIVSTSERNARSESDYAFVEEIPITRRKLVGCK